MKSTAFCLLLCLSFKSFGQEPNLRHVTTDSYKADFYIQMDIKKVKYVDTIFYHWFKSQKIHTTQGYASGDLLTGVYTSYFFSGQLMERGTFDNGLKTGEWKSWYESGQLESIANYESGVLSGNFFKYSENGKLIESGTYKAGKYHGEIIENGVVTEYKNGKRKEEKPEAGTSTGVAVSEKRWFLNWFEKDTNRQEHNRDEKEKFLLKNLFKKKSKGDTPKVKRDKRKSNSTEVVEDNEK